MLIAVFFLMVPADWLLVLAICNLAADRWLFGELLDTDWFVVARPFDMAADWL